MKTSRVAAAGLVALASCSAGFSQALSEPKSSVAVSASFVAPADPRTRNGVGGSFEFEHLFTRSLSAGALAGFWTAESDFPNDSKETYLAAIGTYRSCAGRLRPFLQLGGGIYFLRLHFQSRNRFAPSEKETRGGAFGGGGLDYSLSRSVALEARGRYHLVADASTVHPDFLEAQLGLRYFF
jgi:opacity protein-like surface antigen